MRKIYYILLLLAVTTISTARDRSVREKNHSVYTHEFVYPDVVLPELTTFDFEIIMPYSLTRMRPSRFLTSEIRIEGWQREAHDPSMIISMYLDEPRMSPEELITRYEVQEDSVKNRNGEKVLRHDTTWYYQYRVSMEGRGKLEARDARGQIIQTVYTSRFCAERFSREFCDKREAHRDLRYNADNYRYDMIQEWYEDQMRQATRIAHDRFAFYEKGTKRNLKKIGNNKHKEYANFNQKVVEVANILSVYQPTVNRNTTMRELQTYVDYFERVAKKYNSKKRKARKMQYVALYNQYMLHSLMDNYSDAIVALNRLEQNGIKNYVTHKDNRRLVHEQRRRSLNTWNF